MPNSPNYEFEYESPTSLPGTTLTGGVNGGAPVLALQVDSALASLETETSAELTSLASLISSLQSRVDDLEAAQPLAGRVSVTLDNEISSGFYNSNYWRGTADITFPVGYFSATPSVTATALSTVPGTSMEVGAANVTSAGFTIYVARANTTDTTVMWSAHVENA